MGDNGEIEKETIEQKPEVGIGGKEPKTIIQIWMKPDGSTEMRSSLVPPMVVWTFLKIIFSLFMKEYEPNRVIPAKGGMMNFARRVFKK